MTHLVVGHPDRRQTRGLSGHDIDTIAEVDGQVLHARTGKLEHLVLHEAAFEGCLHQRNSHIVRTNALLRSALEPYEHYLGRVDIPSVAQQLLHELATAFADTHVAKRSIACVAVGTEDHVAALRHLLTHILVDDGLVGGHVDAAVFLGCRETEDVVVFIDGATDGAEGVVAIGHGIGQRELLETTGAGCLDNAHVGDVVRCHRVEADAHLLSLRAVYVVCPQNAVGDGFFACLIGSGQSGSLGHDFFSIQEVNSMFD